VENRRRNDGRETWHRLLNWDKGQTPSERLSALILYSEGYRSINPSHPLGGKDGGKDGILIKDDLHLVMGVYFAREQQTFNTISSKFKSDYKGVEKNDAEGFVFVTNQELRLGERAKLSNLTYDIPVEIYHLERITLILNSPVNYGIRLEFLDMHMTKEETISFYEQRDKSHLKHLTELTNTLKIATRQLTGHVTGGNSYPFIIPQIREDYRQTGIQYAIKAIGQFPLFDVFLKISPKVSPFHKNEKVKAIDSEKAYVHILKNTRNLQLGTLSNKYLREIDLIPHLHSYPGFVQIRVFSRYSYFIVDLELDNHKKEGVTFVSYCVKKGIDQIIVSEWRSPKYK